MARRTQRKGSRAATAAAGGALACALALASGCEKDGAGSDPLAEVDAELSTAIEAVVSAWQEAELEVADVRALEADSQEIGAEMGGECIAAKVTEVPVVLCEHPGEDAAKAAEEKGLELVGDATGLSLARGELVLVAADRHEVDPAGRRINQIANAFRRLE